MPSAISSVANDDLKQQKEAAALYENFAAQLSSNNNLPPELQQLIGCGNGTNLSQVFAYAQQFAAVASMAQQFAAAAAAVNQQTPNSSPRKSPKKSPKTETKREKLKCNGKPTSPSSNGDTCNELLKPAKIEPKIEPELNEKSTSEMTDDFWSNISTSVASSLEDSSTTIEESLLEEKFFDDSGSLPRESELMERKRPAAIQELLQMKKARLSNVGMTTSSPSFNTKQEEMASNESKDTSGSSTGSNGNNQSKVQQWCNGKDDDVETASSSSIENHCAKNANSSTVFNDSTSRAMVDLLASLNGGTETGIQYLKAIQNYPAPKLMNNGTSKSSSPSLKSSPLNRLPQRANDNDVCESPLSSLVPHDRIFAHVPGRLSLLSNVVKYKMTVGEVKRRLMGPESFNFSLLGALLRRAKMPEKSQMLVEELNQVGLSIPRGRRRLSQVTLLSALTESESIQFAKDFQRVAEAEFPVNALAELSVKRSIESDFNNSVSLLNGTLTEFSSRHLEKLNAALDMAREFIQLLDEDRSPVMDSNPEPIFDRRIQDPLSTFSMLTHGFGTPAIRVGVKMFVDFLENQQQLFKEQRQL